MKKIIVVCLLVGLLGFPVIVMAGACGNFDYAELQDMDQATFLQEYCKVRETAPVYINVYMFAPRRDKMIYKDDADSCSDVMGKMERVYMKRFKPESLDALRGECKK